MLDIWKKESSVGSVEVCEYLKRTALDIVVEVRTEKFVTF